MSPAPHPGSPAHTPAPRIVWLRRDLRLDDNPALDAAAASGAPVIPVFVLDPTEEIGGASRWWRGQSLAALDTSLRAIGSRLILRAGRSLDQILRAVAETGASHLHFNRRYEPAGLRIDAEIVTEARRIGLEVHEYPGNRLHEPWALKTLKGDSFRVFTPFWRRLAEQYRSPQAWPKPQQLAAPAAWPTSLPLEAAAEHAHWSAGMAAQWQPGESGAAGLLASLDGKIGEYGDARDRPARDGTSRLSPHLAWGEISVHAIWRRFAAGNPAEHGFLRELGWRDFNSHLLYHFPDLPKRNWNSRFDSFPWAQPGEALRSWQRGLTGYPIVDAGMRQLWQTGWMHNRVRMITASFLIKDLLIDWREGERWFWDTLVDADLAQNSGNWQWVAGSGADAAPYFRIFNPTTQSAKFDPDGDYIRHFVPELAKLPGHHIHAPDLAPASMLSSAGVTLGRDYPRPMVDHAMARTRALSLYQNGKPQRQGDLF
ncbi:deoxyribodipyrimidine photo-lyase [Dongia mobilis]|uniref:Deoxyribodipyrimidine photo-lyase n=1 Tax=Dongia mobilis TaxID=578943 RepID=A0A4R6WJ43_9PROT|nr:deoxyribodipyrimidine photo-lyase [Dongia mobilis]TDQ77694.1 deoxyribodipyrimidine photo-lyase [Dongia mobilis]